MLEVNDILLATTGSRRFLPRTSAPVKGPTVRAHILTPKAGHALEILGHAIDYLADELVHEQGLLVEDKGRVEAINLLMERNRAIYFACPVALTFAERMNEMRSHLFSHHGRRGTGALGRDNE
jgi:hypothetical protein